MTLKTLICRPDGTKTIETKELPDSWFDLITESEEETEK